MNTLTLIGMILIVLGAVGLIYGGINYTSKKDVVDIGALKIQVDQKEHIPLSPIFGAVAVGVVLVIVGRRWTPRGRTV
jgi:uncharacterized membrane protein YidH (DUF202 family)